jgi:hypothetical protein
MRLVGAAILAVAVILMIALPLRALPFTGVSAASGVWLAAMGLWSLRKANRAIRHLAANATPAD